MYSFDPRATTRVGPASVDAEAGLDPALAPGARIGRFEVRGLAGRGGMGVVLEGWDPDLLRPVALKILRSRAADADARERLLREARAVAALSHPHVVTLYDVGTHEADVFLAMEFVRGPNLRTWLTAGRGVEEVLEVFEQAARGLAAAHQAGIVHGDFKPDNVLVGLDGRARVADFGIARGIGERAAGRAAGTPAYMAPEQRAGSAIDGRADQYAWGASLVEALTGSIPSSASLPVTLPEHAPSGLGALLARALAVDPRDRYASIDRLLADLGAMRDDRRAAFLAEATDRLLGVWDPEIAGRARARFVATGLSDASALFDRVAALLDQRLAAWVRQRVEAVVATHLDKTQSERVLDLRIARLDALLAETAALTRLLADDADKDVVVRAVAAVNDLTPLDRQTSVEALLAACPPPADPAVRARVDALTREVDEGDALRRVGRYGACVARLEAIADEARAIDHPPLLARLWFLIGDMRGHSYAPGSADDPLFEAALAAARAGDPWTEAKAWTTAVFVTVVGHRDPRRAADLARVARVAAARLPDDVEIQGTLLNALGTVHELHQEYDLARRSYEASVATWARAHTSPIERLDPVGNLGVIAVQQGRPLEAVTHLRAHVVREEEYVGSLHPKLARTTHNLGMALLDLGEIDEADARFTRALAILREALGGDSDEALTSTGGRCLAACARGDGDEALALANRCVELTAGRRPDNPMVAMVEGGVARAHMVRGDLEQARAFAERSLDKLRAAMDGDHVWVGAALGLVGAVARRQGDAVRARETLARAIAIWDQHLPDGHPKVIEPLLDLALLDRTEGDGASARAHLGRAVALIDALGIVGPLAGAVRQAAAEAAER